MKLKNIMINNFGTKIKTERKRRRLTLEEVGEMIGAGKSYIWELENKKRSNPSAKTALKLARIYEVPLEYLVDDCAKINKNKPKIGDERLNCSGTLLDFFPDWDHVDLLTPAQIIVLISEYLEGQK